MFIDDFNTTINKWISDLERYDYDILCALPAPDKWSMGQLYIHLLEESMFAVEQIELCLERSDHAAGKMNSNGIANFMNNGLPNEIIRGYRHDLPQPESKQQLRDGLVALKKKMNVLGERILADTPIGKTEHPGFGFFSAEEWFRHTEMHLRHHFRQQKRIETSLGVARALSVNS